MYERILGRAWRDLAEPVRRLHGGSAMVRRAHGRLRVRRGRRLIARFVAWAMRLPREAAEVPTDLEIRIEPTGERWTRHFADRTFITTQAVSSEHLLLERFGPCELAFRVEVDDGALVLRQVGAALRAGPLRIPLPVRFVRATGSARAAAADLVRVDVRIDLPVLGMLCAYEGTLRVEPDAEEPSV